MVSKWRLHSRNGSTIAVVGAVLAACTVAGVYMLSSSPKTVLLHVGALTAQIEERASQRFRGSDYPNVQIRSPPAVAQQYFPAAGQQYSQRTEPLVRPAPNLRHHADNAAQFARDAQLEREANDAAKNILDSYGSIFAGIGDDHHGEARRAQAAPQQQSQAQQQQRPDPAGIASRRQAQDPWKNQRKTWQELGVSGPVMGVPHEYSKSAVGRSVQNSGSTMSSTPVQRSPNTNVAEAPALPAFVQRAQEELAHADYVRRHSMEDSLRVSSLPTAESTAITKKTNSAASQGHRHLPKDWVRRLAKTPLLKVPQGATVQTVVQNAVKAALQKQQTETINGNDNNRQLAWAKYLSRARSDRLALSSAAPKPSLRAQQLAIIAKRVAAAQAQAHVASTNPVSHNSVNGAAALSVATPDETQQASEASTEPAEHDSDSRSSAFNAMLRQGLLHQRHHSAAHNSEAAHGGDASPFSEEEQHLHQEIDSIFGPPSAAGQGRAAGGTVRHSSQRATISKLAQAPPAAAVRAAKLATLHRLSAQVEDLVREGAEKLELSKLQEEVKHLQEVKELQTLQSQLKQMRARLQERAERKREAELAAARAHAWRTPMLAAGGDANETAGAGNATDDNATETEAKEEEEPTTVRVCDPMGCREVPLVRPHAAPPPAEFAPRNGTDTKDWLAKAVDSADIWQSLLPWATWDKSLEPEVHLDENGTIHADHDDPYGRLIPHNEYQEDAVYPDGSRHPAEGGYGIRNSLAVGLFDDNIVAAAPGFNAGEGRHVRTQQAADWERNWGSHVVKGDKILVN